MLLGEMRYYEIFLLSLMWLSEDDGVQDRPRSISPTLYTLRGIGLIDEKQRKAAMRNERLRDRLLMKIDICKARVGYTYQEALEHSVRQSSKHLALPIPTESPFERRRVMAKNGYRFILTDSGLRFAEKKVGSYENIVTREQFLQGHAAMREQVARIMSSVNARRRAAGEKVTLTVVDEEFADINPQDLYIQVA